MKVILDDSSGILPEYSHRVSVADVLGVSVMALLKYPGSWYSCLAIMIEEVD